MFAINPSNLPRVASWQQAKDFWERAKPLKINPDQRFLAGSRDLSKLVIRHPGEAYAFRYHQTDVVTYHPDGRLVIKPWQSTSTALFARRLCPSYLNIEGSSGTRHRNAYFQVNNCRTRSEFVVDTFKERLLPETLEVDYRVIRVSNKDGEYTKLARRFIELRTAHETLAGAKPWRHSGPIPVNEWRWAARRVESDWLSLLYDFKHRFDDDLVLAGLILDRAIVREPILFGEPVKRTKYSHLWQVVEDR